MVLLLGLHGHGVAGARSGHDWCWEDQVWAPPHHPAQVKTGDRLCVLCSLSVLRPGLRSPDLSCQRGAAD